MQAEFGQERLIARIGIEDAQAPAARFSQVEGGTGECAQEGRVHGRTSLQINHEVLCPLSNNGLKAALYLDAVLEGATPINAHPKNPADTTNEYV